MNKNNQTIPVITIDGTAGSGKGTISTKLSKELGWHLLDSGMLYRAVALSYIRHLLERSISTNQNHSNDDRSLINESQYWQTLSDSNLNLTTAEPIIASLALNLQCVFKDQEVYIKDQYNNLHKVTSELRSEFCGNLASKLAELPMVRSALFGKQNEFLQLPGLVADGRDMGTVIFPEAKLKIFLDADPNIRLLRRGLQLKELGVDGNLCSRAREFHERDLRDQRRDLAPLKPAKDAIQIDTTTKTIEEVFEVIMNQVNLIILR